MPYYLGSSCGTTRIAIRKPLSVVLFSLKISCSKHSQFHRHGLVKCRKISNVWFARDIELFGGIAVFAKSTLEMEISFEKSNIQGSQEL